MKQQYLMKRRHRLIPVTRQRVASEIKMARQMGVVFYIMSINGRKTYTVINVQFVPEQYECVAC